MWVWQGFGEGEVQSYSEGMLWNVRGLDWVRGLEADRARWSCSSNREKLVTLSVACCSARVVFMYKMGVIIQAL